jgi:iron complex transport system substrate-binding protein
VRAQSVAGGPIYHINSDFVAQTNPDIIITQEQCRICAVTPEDVAAALIGCPAIKMVTIKPVTLDDVLGDVVRIAKALGVQQRGERLVDMLKQRLSSVTLCAQKSNPNGALPTVAHVEWLAPLMGSGYWIAECVSTACCIMVHGSAGGHSPTLTGLNQLASAEVLILAPCGFGIERTRLELFELGMLTRPEWLALPAVRAQASSSSQSLASD